MVREDPQKIIDEVYKVLTIMGVMPMEKAELTAYQLKVLLKFGLTNERKQDQMLRVP